MDDDIVDSFVECMLPLVVSSVFSVQCSFPWLTIFWVNFLSVSLSKQVISKK
jgi:hypothetical protein